MNTLQRILHEPCEIILTIDCEGPKYDKDIPGNTFRMLYTIKEMRKLGVPVVLFLTPGFVMENSPELVQAILSLDNVVCGLHIHVEDLPRAVTEALSFDVSGGGMLADLSPDQQAELVDASISCLRKFGIAPKGFRGGFFSLGDATVEAMKAHDGIVFESHNIFREQYQVGNSHLVSLPILAEDDWKELRIERFDLEGLVALYIRNAPKYRAPVTITHSCCFNDEAHIGKLMDFAARCKCR